MKAMKMRNVRKCCRLHAKLAENQIGICLVCAGILAMSSMAGAIILLLVLGGFVLVGSMWFFAKTYRMLFGATGYGATGDFVRSLPLTEKEVFAGKILTGSLTAFGLFLLPGGLLLFPFIRRHPYKQAPENEVSDHPADGVQYHIVHIAGTRSRDELDDFHQNGQGTGNARHHGARVGPRVAEKGREEKSEGDEADDISDEIQKEILTAQLFETHEFPDDFLEGDEVVCKAPAGPPQAFRKKEEGGQDYQVEDQRQNPGRERQGEGVFLPLVTAHFRAPYSL